MSIMSIFIGLVIVVAAAIVLTLAKEIITAAVRAALESADPQAGKKGDAR